MTPLGQLSSRRIDVALALGVAVVQSAALLLLGYVDAPAVSGSVVHAAAALLGVEGLSLVLWRSRPLACLALVWSIEVLITVILPDGYSMKGVGLVVVSFAIGMRLPLRPATMLLSLLTVVDVVIRQWTNTADPWSAAAGALLILLGLYLLPMLGGAGLASRLRYERSRQELVRREHERQAELALIQERRRLAGELHDVAAHHLAGIVVQAAAIERLIDRDPATAAAAASQLRGQAKEALDGLRSVVGLLRRDHDDGAAPGLEDLGELVAATRDLGVDIGLEADEGLAAWPALSPLAGATAYRVAQQAVSNALQHAPGSAVRVQVRVEVRREGDSLVLLVVNGPAQQEPGEPGGGGNGLPVMRERAAWVGGSLQAGPAPGGGWRVRLVLPLGQEEDT